MAYPFAEIEPRWQQFWRDHGVYRALDPDETTRPGFYVLDMFPYPSGSGLHVGHPEGYTATDIVSRYKRLRGFNVLHPMGWDAFGLPAEQYAIKTGTHPRQTTEQNVATFRRQIEMLGLGYDWSREINTTDPGYYKWTQWIFLQLYNSYFDPIARRAMPVAHLHNELFNGNYLIAPDDGIVENPTQEGFEAIGGEVSLFRHFESLSPADQRRVIDNQRLAYVAEVPVNWCPGLGTTLSNEEVIDGRSEVGGFPVERRPLRQWMLRITAYADRLMEDLGALDWPESLKEMQRNWIGRSTGATVEFDVQGHENESIEVYTTRPDTLFGATYMVLAPEHPLVARITTGGQHAAVEAYRAEAAARSERDRMADAKEKTGVFTGAYAINPVNDEPIPVWVADYVLMGYGTGAIMAVPAHDERDFEFARKFGLPIREVVRRGPGFQRTAEQEPDGPDAQSTSAFTGEGVAVNSDFLDGLPTAEAKERMIAYLHSEGIGRARTNYKLRDWLFSRQRYWGEPFPILIDPDGNHHAVAESDLPVTLPPMEDFKPTGSPEGPLSKAADWLHVVSTDNLAFTRETNTMPQWAGSCWYYLRYLDPKNPDRFLDPEKERYWMPVDLYVGGVEHAVLHLLYARFWHKVLFDLGHVSTPEPFQKLVNQGLILGETEYHFFEKKIDGRPSAVSVDELTDLREEATSEGVRLVATERATGQTIAGVSVPEVLIEKKGATAVLRADPSIKVDARSFKMSKSRGNVVNPDQIVAEYGADVFRLYEMYMGPLEAQKPWNTRDIVGMQRFLSRVYRAFIGDTDAQGTHVPAAIGGNDLPPEIERQMHRAIKKVGEDIEAMRFNTAIAELIELINAVVKLEAVPRPLVRIYALLLSPFAPHLAEEIWAKTLHMETSIVGAEWPTYDPAKLVELTVEVPVQVNGKLRGKVSRPADADEAAALSAAEAEVARHLEGKAVRKRIYVPGKMVNLVVG